jgi:hypothetical protein
MIEAVELARTPRLDEVRRLKFDLRRVLAAKERRVEPRDRTNRLTTLAQTVPQPLAGDSNRRHRTDTRDRHSSTFSHSTPRCVMRPSPNVQRLA